VKTIDAHRIAVTVRDGSRLVVRPVRPDDRALLLAGFERLGPESRYKRFLAPMPELTDDVVAYLTSVDHHDHEALAARSIRPPERGWGSRVSCGSPSGPTRPRPPSR